MIVGPGHKPPDANVHWLGWLVLGFALLYASFHIGRYYEHRQTSVRVWMEGR